MIVFFYASSFSTEAPDREEGRPIQKRKNTYTCTCSANEEMYLSFDIFQKIGELGKNNLFNNVPWTSVYPYVKE